SKSTSTSMSVDHASGRQDKTIGGANLPPMGLRAILLVVVAATAFACSTSPRRPDGQVGLLPVGAPAPEVIAADASGGGTRLSSLRGRAVVVYFYPADGTPGCRKEACAFRDAWTKLQAAHVAVIGVSSQSRDSHVAFEREEHLPFPLAADESGAVQRAYG